MVSFDYVSGPPSLQILISLVNKYIFSALHALFDNVFLSYSKPKSVFWSHL